MRDIDRAQKLLGLFTSADCAEALAGDLIEERRSRGVFWFWRHVLGTVLAVSRSAVIDAPVRTLSLVAAGCALFATPAFAGVAAVSLFPQLLGTLVSWIVLSFFWWGGGLWAGASLVTIAQGAPEADQLLPTMYPPVRDYVAQAGQRGLDDPLFGQDRVPRAARWHRVRPGCVSQE